MSRQPCLFRQTDVKRAVRAAEQAGLTVARVEIDARTGKIIIATGRPQEDGEARDARDVVDERLRAAGM